MKLVLTCAGDKGYNDSTKYRQGVSLVEKHATKQRKLTAYWLFNLILGVPTPFVFVLIIINYYGLLAPAQPHEQILALAVLAIYLLVWLGGNYACLRQESWNTRIGMLALSPLLIAATGFISFKLLLPLF
ncbi:hypothetical protein [Paenibacillus sedimenti]|uniref:Uncharacterized protein n=1 Tax=Paenibacillus sedimenti TaxID=2770274 RepID=A0A926QK83_9BACL|nr:hypothetical protein [Paenibacillus sedimenti]MBD0382330.1 hypothetical protein [Paenibacillus sedimenti]